MNAVLALIPARYRHAAKAWVAGFGTVLAAVVQVIPHLPGWLSVVVAALTALGVYGTPNVPQDTGDDS